MVALRVKDDPTPHAPLFGTLNSLSFRRAIETDTPAIVALVESAFRGEGSRIGWTTEADLLDGQRTDLTEVGALIADPNSCMLLAERTGTLVGCVKLVREANVGVIGMVSVVPALQRAGIGKSLLREAERVIVAEWGLRRATMTVIVQRDTLIAWYERHGYRRTGMTSPFPYGQPRFGLPKRNDLAFETLEKALGGPSPADDALPRRCHGEPDGK